MAKIAKMKETSMVWTIITLLCVGCCGVHMYNLGTKQGIVDAVDYLTEEGYLHLQEED